MTAYCIFQVDVTDPEQYEKYKAAVSPSIKAAGGDYLVRGGAVEVLEGDPDARRMVILEFPTVAAAKAWWDSAEYAEIKKLRAGAGTMDGLVVEGL